MAIFVQVTSGYLPRYVAGFTALDDSSSSLVTTDDLSKAVPFSDSDAQKALEVVQKSFPLAQLTYVLEC